MRILLADDHTLVRAGLRALLESIDDVTAISEAGDGRRALELVAAERPDVALLDISMPGLNGLEVAARVTSDSPRTRLVILSMHSSPSYVAQALRAGAVGYLLKDVSSARLVEAVLTAAAGGSVLEPSVAAKVVARVARLPADEPTGSARRAQPLVVPLSEREVDVLRLLADGRSNREIAGRLHLAEGTVKNHVTNVLGKLGARDRTQAALRARALDLL